MKTTKKYSDYRITAYEAILNSRNTEIAEENTKKFLANYNISDKDELKKLLYSILPHGKGDTFKDKTITLFFDFYLYWQNKNSWSETEKKKFIQNKLKSRYKDISSKKPSYYLVDP